MTEQPASTQESAAAIAKKEEKKNLYETEIDRFNEVLEKDKKYAYDRYGFTLLYSLPPEQIFKIKMEMGWQGKDALDFYNLGVVACQEEAYKEALKHFQKAESMNCDQPELFYNIAAIHEDGEENDKAKEYYQKYIDVVEKWDHIPKNLQLELDEVREHIKTL